MPNRDKTLAEIIREEWALKLLRIVRVLNSQEDEPFASVLPTSAYRQTRA